MKAFINSISWLYNHMRRLYSVVEYWSSGRGVFKWLSLITERERGFSMVNNVIKISTFRLILFWNFRYFLAKFPETNLKATFFKILGMSHILRQHYFGHFIPPPPTCQHWHTPYPLLTSALPKPLILKTIFGSIKQWNVRRDTLLT